MNLVEISTAIGILGSFSVAIGGYWKNNNRINLEIQHLQDTKENRDGLSEEVNKLNIGVQLANHKLDEQDKKINVLFDKLDRLENR